MALSRNNFFSPKKYLGNINKLNRSERIALKQITQIALLKGEKIEQLSDSDNRLLLDISNAVFDVCSQILSYKEAYSQNIFVYANKLLGINACASRHADNIYSIGINIGSISHMHRLTLLLFSKESFMKKIGGLNTLHDEKYLYIGELYKDIPNCPVRLEYAGNVTILSMLVFFYHELAHIFRGHLDYLIDRYLLNAINDGEMDYLDIEIRKTLECDADYYSGYFLGLTYKNEPALFKTIFNVDNSIDFFKSCTLAAKLAFHSFEKSMPANNYHLPKTRLEIFLEGLTSSLDLADVALENAIGVILGVDKAFVAYDINLGNSPEMVEKDGREFYETTNILWGILEQELAAIRS